ncbi:hypothetical protein B0H94_1236 [Salsuginibacillus halophilus]|uniref:Uncharacterized protein n=1 Tax=Salsuginibacillus halophilus TaxID=517424 RepID=A0A2P8H3N9_9BACI|nr:hypothetical protein B0H94_1236 [Salsuginibacillus halophilus]
MHFRGGVLQFCWRPLHFCSMPLHFQASALHRRAGGGKVEETGGGRFLSSKFELGKAGCRPALIHLGKCALHFCSMPLHFWGSAFHRVWICSTFARGRSIFGGARSTAFGFAPLLHVAAPFSGERVPHARAGSPEIEKAGTRPAFSPT